MTDRLFDDADFGTASALPAADAYAGPNADATTDSGSPSASQSRGALATAAALVLAACGGEDGGASGGASSGGSTVAAPPPPPPWLSTAQSNQEAARFLLHASFSATDDAIASVRQLGYSAWLDQEMARPVANLAWDWMEAQGYNGIDTNNYFDNSYPGDRVMWRELVSSTDQLRKRVALALSEIFVVSLNGLDFSWRSSALAFYWDQLVGNAFGSFRTLLEDVTLSPAMGFYLSTRGNQREDTRSGRVPDENYAREVMQLFTIGLVELNSDGTPRVDANGKQIDTYTSSDVSNLARVFTGYDFDATGNVRTTLANGRRIDSPAYARRPMTTNGTVFLNPTTTNRHSLLQKSFLGVTIPENTDAATSLKTALDTLANHKNVGPFFGRQMIQRLVTSNPSPAYVSRVAAAFENNGAGVRGDLKAVVKAVLTDREALDPAGLTSNSFGKVREPIVRLAQWARTFGATSSDGRWLMGDLSNPATQLGQSPMRSPSVFNFFRPGFVPPNTSIADQKLTAPEFQLINETSVSGYVNFMTNVIRSGISGNVVATYADLLTLVLDPDKLVDRVDLLLTAGQLTPATRTEILNALRATTVTETSTDSVKRNRVFTAVLLVMASPEYLIQR
jgi:uncharacterized protein (DUF1800 family)